MKYLIQSLAVAGLMLDILGVICLISTEWEKFFPTSFGKLLEKIPLDDGKEKHWYKLKNPTSCGIKLIILGFLVLLLAAILGFFVID